MSKQFYLDEVETMLKRLREYCLGMNIPLKALLPKGGNRWTADRRAKYIARTILFAIVAESTDCDDIGALQMTANWLYEVIYYLESQCCSRDHTFFSVCRLVHLEKDIRGYLFEDDRFRHLREEPPRILRMNLERAIVVLLEERRELESGKRIVDEVWRTLETESHKNI